MSLEREPQGRKSSWRDRERQRERVSEQRETEGYHRERFSTEGATTLFDSFTASMLRPMVVSSISSLVALPCVLLVCIIGTAHSTETHAPAAAPELGAYFSYYYFEKQKSEPAAAGHWHGSYYAHPSPRSFPAPDDLGRVVVPAGPAPAPQAAPGAEASPSPLFFDSSPAMTSTTTTTTTTTEAFGISPRRVTFQSNDESTATTTTTAAYRDPDCHTTIQGVPCEDDGQCAVDPVSGWPFCWTSSLDWVSLAVVSQPAAFRRQRAQEMQQKPIEKSKKHKLLPCSECVLVCACTGLVRDRGAGLRRLIPGRGTECNGTTLP